MLKCATGVMAALAGTVRRGCRIRRRTRLIELLEIILVACQLAAIVALGALVVLGVCQ